MKFDTRLGLLAFPALLLVIACIYFFMWDSSQNGAKVVESPFVADASEVPYQPKSEIEGNQAEAGGVQRSPHLDINSLIELVDTADTGIGRFNGWVVQAGKPVSGAEVTHVGQVAFSDLDGSFSLKKIVPWNEVVIRHGDSPPLFGVVRMNNARYEMASSSRLIVSGTGNPSRIGGAVTTLLWSQAELGLLSVMDQMPVLWQGNLSSNGDLDVANIPTTLPGVQGQLDPFFLRIEFPGGQSIVLRPRVSWEKRESGEWVCKISSSFHDKGPVGSIFLLVKEESGKPLSRRLEYRCLGGTESPWRSGKTDEDGLMFLEDDINPRGQVMVWLTPRLSYSQLGGNLLAVEGGKVLAIPMVKPIQVRVKGGLPAGVSLEGTLVAWKEDSMSNSFAGLLDGPGAPRLHDWSSVPINQLVAIDGGWVGSRRGIAIRALPGPSLLELEPVTGETAAISIPKLALVRAKISGLEIPSDLQAKISASNGPEQKVPFYFPLTRDGVSTFAVPVGSYWFWLHVPGLKDRLLGRFDFSEGVSSVEFSTSAYVKCKLEVGFSDQPLASGKFLRDGALEPLDWNGQAEFWTLPNQQLPLVFQARGILRKGGIDGLSTVGFLGYEGIIQTPGVDGGVSLTIPSGSLVLRGHPTEDREAAIHFANSEGVESPAIVLQILAGTHQELILPCGRYHVSCGLEYERKSFEINRENSTQIDLP